MPLNQRKAINNVRIRMIFLFLNNLEDCRRHSPGIGIAAHLHQCAVMFWRCALLSPHRRIEQYESFEASGRD